MFFRRYDLILMYDMWYSLLSLTDVLSPQPLCRFGMHPAARECELWRVIDYVLGLLPGVHLCCLQVVGINLFFNVISGLRMILLVSSLDTGQRLDSYTYWLLFEFLGWSNAFYACTLFSLCNLFVPFSLPNYLLSRFFLQIQAEMIGKPQWLLLFSFPMSCAAFHLVKIVNDFSQPENHLSVV